MGLSQSDIRGSQQKYSRRSIWHEDDSAKDLTFLVKGLSKQPLEKPGSSSRDTQNVFKNINRVPGWGCKHCTLGQNRNPALWRLWGKAWRDRSCVCRRSSVVVRRQDCELGHTNSHPALLQNTGMTGSVRLFLSVSVKQNKLYFPHSSPESHMWLEDACVF